MKSQKPLTHEVHGILPTTFPPSPWPQGLCTAAPSAWSTLPQVSVWLAPSPPQVSVPLFSKALPGHLTQTCLLLSTPSLLSLLYFSHRIFHHLTCSTFHVCILIFVSFPHYNLHEGRGFSPRVHCYLPNTCNNSWHIRVHKDNLSSEYFRKITLAPMCVDCLLQHEGNRKHGFIKVQYNIF